MNSSHSCNDSFQLHFFLRKWNGYFDYKHIKCLFLNKVLPYRNKMCDCILLCWFLDEKTRQSYSSHFLLHFNTVKDNFKYNDKGDSLASPTLLLFLPHPSSLSSLQRMLSSSYFFEFYMMSDIKSSTYNIN